MKREFLQNLTVGDQPLPKEVIDAIMEEHGKGVQKAKLWQEKYEQAVLSHETALQQVRFEHLLETAIQKAGGRNAKAITALLDVDALRQSGDVSAVDTALEQLKSDGGYLFSQAAPPYAVSTGAQLQQPGTAPATLAGALRERFEKNK